MDTQKNTIPSDSETADRVALAIQVGRYQMRDYVHADNFVTIGNEASATSVVHIGKRTFEVVFPYPWDDERCSVVREVVKGTTSTTEVWRP